MALIKFGGGVVDMRGSIAGNTFARNSYGNYVRAKTMPVNPNTALQQAIRSKMQSLVAVWSAILTGAQRAAWQVFASNISWTNRLGETIELSGYNHFIRANLVLLNAGLARVDDGPTIFSLPQADETLSIAVSEATGLMTVTFDDTRGWVDLDEAGMVVFAGNPVSITTNFFNGPWKTADTIEGDSITPETSPVTMTDPYQIAEDEKQFFYARICEDDGRVSQPFRTTVIVGA